MEAGGTFVREPEYTLFSRAYEDRPVYLAESIEIPFDRSRPEFGGTVSARLPPKGDIVRRITVRSTLPELYTPLGPGYVYPLYTDQVLGDVFVSPDTLAIAPGDFVGYFNTQYLNFWATNFTGYTITVAYDSAVNKFVFSSSAYSNIFFKNDSSGVFWGFDPRTFDFVTPGGYKGYNLTGGTLVAPLTLVQAGWIRGFTPPPPTGFSYKDSVACRLVKTAVLSIGGQTIDRLTSERLIIEDDLGIPYENQAALTILEGKNDPSGVYAPREYYTRLTFNMDTLPVTQMYRNDVRVDLEYEKFENLPSVPITTNGFFDADAWAVSNICTLTDTPRYDTAYGVGYKNYIILGPLVDGKFKIYNQDTTVFYTWSPTNGPATDYRMRTVVIGNSIYLYTGPYLLRASIDTILLNPYTPWTISTYSPFAGFPPIFYGEGTNKICDIAADARYIYVYYDCNYYTIAGYRTAISSSSLAGDNHTWTINILVAGPTSAPLSPTSNAAFVTFFTTYGPAFTTNTITQVMSGSNLMFTWSAYYTATQTPGQQNTPCLNAWNNRLMMRYDTFSDIDVAGSYTYATTAAGFPLSIKDAFLDQYVMVSIPNDSFLRLPFDGRYLYTGLFGPVVIKYDTQNFLSNSYTQTTSAQLSPFPVESGGGGVWQTDGTYTYVGGCYLPDSSEWVFTRYNNKYDISNQASWEYFYGTTLPTRNQDQRSDPIGFDGKYVYFADGGGFTDPGRRYVLYTYDTTLPFTDVNSWKWLDFRTDGSVRTSIGTTFTKPLLYPSLSTFSPLEGTGAVVGSRYIYIFQIDGRDYSTRPNFITFDPLAMVSSLSSSLIVKYEKYEKPPDMPKMLYGQTDLNEFTMRTGRTQDQFQLRFQGPVREFWVTVDSPGVVTRIRLLFNGEVIVDDDQVTTRTIRAFEHHTAMPSSNVCTYSFAIEPEKLAPSGSVNFSRIATPMLEVTLASIPTTDLTVRVYAKIFNVLTNQNGLGGLLFNSAL
jgi:hypothetical protein